MQPRLRSHVSAQLIRPPSWQHIKWLQLRCSRGHMLFVVRHRLPVRCAPPPPPALPDPCCGTAHPWQPWPRFQISFPDALFCRPPITRVQGLFFFFSQVSPPRRNFYYQRTLQKKWKTFQIFFEYHTVAQRCNSSVWR